jgi:hypothetical protein
VLVGRRPLLWGVGMPSWVPVRMRSGAIAAQGRVHAVLPGGLVIESTWPWPRGTAVELQLTPSDDEVAPRVRATIVGERGDVYVVSLADGAEETGRFVREIRLRFER